MWRLLFTTCLVAATCLKPARADDDVEPRPTVKFRHEIKGYHGSNDSPPKSPDGNVSVRIDGLTVRLHDARKDRQVALRHPDRPRKGLMAVSRWAFSPDGRMIAVAIGDEKHRGTDDTAGSVRVWEVSTGRLVKAYDKDIGRVTGLKFLDNRTVQIYGFDISGK